MKRNLWISLTCIKPNAEKNVKPASPNRAAWVLPLWIAILFVISPYAHSLDEPIPVPEITVDSSIQEPPPAALSSNAADKTIGENIIPVDTLPQITANKFSVRILKHTASKRIYLIQFADQLIPKPGAILLLKSQAESIMAFRVIKVSLTDQTVIGQVIKKYGDHTELQSGEQYDAIEKAADIEEESDIIDAPEAEFEDPSWATKEVDAPILSYDPELDVGSPTPAEVVAKAKLSPMAALESKVGLLESKLVELETKTAMNAAEVTREPSEVKKPAPVEAKEPVEKKPEEKPEEKNKPPERLDDDLLDKEEITGSQDSTSVDEVKLFDNYAHWISAGFGYVTNNSPNGTGLYNFSAGNLKYGVTIGRRMFAEKAHLQDSLVLEGKVFLYKGINFAAQGDSYTVLSVAGNLRYNLFFSEGFGIFGYAGMMQSNVLASASGVTSAIAALNSVLPSVGGGILLQIGPSWYARLDIGMDDTSLNLLLRF
ncbi:MAG: hypothetical protein ABIQ95_09090 [Bdellovibrionia bacterium]